MWPLGTDQYDHAELAANWDRLDAILGSPSVGAWPARSGVGGGLYAEVKLAKDSAIPLGVVFPFFRPTTGVALPAGAVPCDGATYTYPDHDFPGGGDVTVPDLRNAFVAGADPDAEIGAAGAPAGSTAARLPEGAPGPQGTGGSNAVAMTADTLPAHTHEGSLTGWSPTVMMWYAQNSTAEEMKNAPQYLDERDEAIERCGRPGCYYDPERTQPRYNYGQFEYEWWGSGVNHSTGRGGWQAGQHKHTISELSLEGSGTAHENRPRYIGLIWMVKVKVSA